MDLAIGKRSLKICSLNSVVGRIVYIGEVHYSAGIFVGIVVLGGGGKNNGIFLHSVITEALMFTIYRNCARYTILFVPP